MDNYIKSATDYAINSKTRNLKDFDKLVENSRDRLQIMNIEYNRLFNILYDIQVELAESYYDYNEKYLKETL